MVGLVTDERECWRLRHRPVHSVVIALFEEARPLPFADAVDDAVPIVGLCRIPQLVVARRCCDDPVLLPRDGHESAFDRISVLHKTRLRSAGAPSSPWPGEDESM